MRCDLFETQVDTNEAILGTRDFPSLLSCPVCATNVSDMCISAISYEAPCLRQGFVSFALPINAFVTEIHGLKWSNRVFCWVVTFPSSYLSHPWLFFCITTSHPLPCYINAPYQLWAWFILFWWSAVRFITHLLSSCRSHGERPLVCEDTALLCSIEVTFCEDLYVRCCSFCFPLVSSFFLFPMGLCLPLSGFLPICGHLLDFWELGAQQTVSNSCFWYHSMCLPAHRHLHTLICAIPPCFNPDHISTLDQREHRHCCT